MKKFNASLVVLIVICLLLAGGFGYITGVAVKNGAAVGNLANVNNLVPQDKSLGLFDSESATIVGRIRQVNGTNVAVENSAGKTGDFGLADNVNISRTTNGQRVATTSAGETKFITVDETALIVFGLQDGVFKVTSITYLPTPTQKKYAPTN